MIFFVNFLCEIEDLEDWKFEDWDERLKILDLEVVKLDDWDEDVFVKILDEEVIKFEGWLDDEFEYVFDLDVEKFEDWDEDMDGEWEVFQIVNFRCELVFGCGVWQ